MIRSDFSKIIEAHKLLIKANKHKVLKYFEDFYDDTNDELNDRLNDYEANNLLRIKYYNLLDSVGKFINKYDIDISIIKKPTIDKINDHCRLDVLKRVCFSEPEDEINDDDEDEIDDDDNNNNNEKNIKNKTKEIIIDNKNIASDIMDDLRIVLKKAIINNNEELMNNTIKLMNTLSTANQENNINTATNQENNINTVTNQENNINTVITYFKFSEWIKVNTCNINPENNKKLGNKSFKYAIAASKTSGKNRHRLKNIQKFINDFAFKDIDYPLEKKDYEAFENNNPSIKLTIFKTTENEKELLIHYNQVNNDRENKIDLLLLGNNHYIYVTELNLLTKYIKHD